eukprot:CAMPEP_0197439340 /NCGR_PEP_ID=MMETSP1175-20131217/6107_1 /TAXON_ID=1003142 /ORGANISM="Triceratium dubium, Strain CCMP147" /LENGTH=294 /DNA_ID=CAMNT_0042969241 /DNA_START=83 /DNA_END=964 /DNA_ORIENTATION=-
MTRGRVYARIAFLIVVATTSWFLVWLHRNKPDHWVYPIWLSALLLAPWSSIFAYVCTLLLVAALEAILLEVDGTIVTPDGSSKVLRAWKDEDGRRMLDIEFYYEYDGKKYTTSHSLSEDYVEGVQLRLHPSCPEFCVPEGKGNVNIWLIALIWTTMFVLSALGAFSCVEMCAESLMRIVDSPRILASVAAFEGLLAVAALACFLPMKRTELGTQHNKAMTVAKFLWFDSCVPNILPVNDRRWLYQIVAWLYDWHGANNKNKAFSNKEGRAGDHDAALQHQGSSHDDIQTELTPL